jgi:flagellar assembly protein FliH
MPLMKAKSTPRMRETSIVMDLSDLEHEASQLIARARNEATRIINEAKAIAERDALKIREDARILGQAAGLKAGIEEGRVAGHADSTKQYAQALLELTTRWSQTLDLLHQSMPTHAADAKTDLVRLALAIADRVTHQHALLNRQVAQATVEETLKMMGAARTVVLLVHPTEIETLENFLPDLLAKIRAIDSIELTPDDTITPGGCTVRFGSGQIDATIETQIQRIADELLAEASST